MKADDKVKYEDQGENKEEDYTHFEVLQKRVEQLQEILEEVVGILNENNIHRNEKITASYFDDDKLYTELEEEKE